MSYIHVDDYASPRQLAAYLHHLDKNITAYNTYFSWKGTMVTINQRYWCRLCALLHLQQTDGYVHWYQDYTVWWNGVCTAGCVSLRHSAWLSVCVVCIGAFYNCYCWLAYQR